MFEVPENPDLELYQVWGVGECGNDEKMLSLVQKALIALRKHCLERWTPCLVKGTVPFGAT